MDDLPSWEAEYRGLPGALPITRVVLAGALVAALVLVGQSATDSGQASDVGQYGPACAELARLRSHGVVSGAWYGQVRAACARSGGH
jgi:hypothetical protein